MLCTFFHVAVATATKIDHGFYQTFSDEKVVSWPAVLNVSTRSVTAGVIVCNLVTRIVNRSLGILCPIST